MNVEANNKEVDGIWKISRQFITPMWKIHDQDPKITLLIFTIAATKISYLVCYSETFWNNAPLEFYQTLLFQNKDINYLNIDSCAF